MKGPNSNNKSSLKEGNTYPATINIYPGINPTTKIANECSSLTFVSVFPRLQQWLTSQNLEQFIKDQNGDKIPFVTTANATQSTLADQITIETYESIKAQRLATFRDEFRTRWNQELYSVHQYLKIRYPSDVLALITNKELKANAKRFNSLPANSHLPTDNIYFGDERVDTYILDKFHQSYNHFSTPIHPLVLTNDMRRARLHQIGLLQQLEKDIQSAKIREQTKETSQSENIRLMKVFFTQIVTNYPPEITTLVDNREFANAWNKILVYNLEIIDSDNIELSLQSSILNLEFDINIDKTFLGYYERHLITHALLLFKRWHNYITYDECKNIVDVMTDPQFAQKYATFISLHSLALPDLCTENSRLQILKAAFKGTHLQETLSTFDQLQPNPHLQTVSDLKTALSNKDNSTENKYGRKSKSGSLTDTCITCKYLKEDLGFDNAVNHPAHEPCPVLNLEVWKTYFKKHPVVRSDRSSTNARQQSNTSNPRGTKPFNNSSTLHMLPANFDELKTCSHCYRSGQGSGRDSASRKQAYTQHPSTECPYLKLKQSNRQGASRHPSPGMKPPYQSNQSGGYSNSNSSYNPNHQGNSAYYGQDTGQSNNNQYPQDQQQQQFLGNNTFDQHGQNNHRDHNNDRGRDRDRDRDRQRDRERTREHSQSTHNSESGRDISRSRSRDRN